MFFGVEDLKTDEIFLKLTKTCEEQPEVQFGDRPQIAPIFLPER